ncbi:hypothetical protein [Bradyrhizobium sp. dw_78]|uniref:hypothetical protein n=1 Tax=Bradyrhizobium sp. dw_78 TaxID=2719793 RepID=UPI001BD661A1|nr:hypothetical protein [Bradyrhizobium sp. dw_78]
MNRISRLLAVSVLLCCALPARGTENAALERGAAITDPFALRELDGGRFALGRMLAPSRTADAPLANRELFALPSMAPIRKALDGEFDRYVARHKAEFPGESIGVGESFAFRLFDRAQLYSDDSRFVLSGIVNRMDRGYVAPDACGEIRLIYRLTRTGITPAGDDDVSPRLPMTLMVVLKAKGDHAADNSGAPVICAEIARRWLATSGWTSTGKQLAEKLTAQGGPLDPVTPADVERIETNLQIAHAPKSAARDFRTDYLMKVFDYHAESRTFDEAPLEDQIDRDRILADANLKRAFKAWLLDPEHFSALDRGTVLIPPEFLATGAIATTPVGFGISNLQPEFGLTQGDDAKTAPLFSDSDVVSALEKAAGRGMPTQNIRSVAGFERRLNDITCAGCHQTRGIGGFHFPGVDWMREQPSNTTFVPASPHFFGDQIRRRDILTALRDGRPPDYSRGFSNRPQLRGSTELAGTEYDDGWGAHCYRPVPGANARDASFRSWSCAKGLACQVVDATSRMGMCFVKTR